MTLTVEHEKFLSTVLDEPEATVARASQQIAAALRPARPTPPPLSATYRPYVPKLHFGDYLSSSAEPPASVHRGLFKGYSDPLGNVNWGDCCEAMGLHGIEGMRHAAGMAPPPFVRQDALSLYSLLFGFNIAAGPSGSNPTDNGSDNAVFVDYWKNTGITCAADGSVHKIVEGVSVDATSDLECQIAIYELGVLFCAWALPINTMQTDPNVWRVVGDGKTGNSAPGSAGYHDTVAMSYSGAEIDIDTWGFWTPVTADYRRTYQNGFFAVLSEDMLGRRGLSPSGVDWSRLNSDVQLLNSGQPIQ